MNSRTFPKGITWILALSFLLLLSVVICVMTGSVSLPFHLTWKIILSHLPFFNFDPSWTPAQESIVWNLRLPRVFLALIVGAMLATSGVAFQGILRNPLADPYILGVSSGAAFGAASAILFFRSFSFFGQSVLPLFAFAGGLISLAFVFSLSRQHGQFERETLILAGVVVQALLSAFLSLLIAVSGEQMQQIIFWMMGSLANSNWQNVLILLPYFLIGLTYLLFQNRELNVIALGERAATHLGINVERKKIAILIVGSLLATAAVSMVGIIGFVGLIIPHLMRLLVGPDHRILLPISTLAGAIFLLWSDTIARTLLQSQEIPIGAITAFVGAPFFAYLLKSGLRRG
ncbi:iron ABC transporter permease [Desulfitobacterium sp. PCE1]|uniref:FecCD family ABC transporter permease n=1 Tax=Desulfitobacterium sp. PCE1 TaxID=146907 RepID=UPI0003781157|nr:iron ABC transporter permease [Desulfitobacterium sp. PCE1]